MSRTIHLITIFALLAMARPGAAQQPYGSDSCAMAPHFMNLPYAAFANFTTASDSPSDPVHSCTGSADHRSVWFSFTPSFSGGVVVSTLPPIIGFPVVLSSYTGSCGALAEGLCQVSANGLFAETLQVVAGQMYYFEVAVTTAATGVIQFHVVRAPYCGDGVVNQLSEECDDGNAFEGDACTTTCDDALCGDGFVYLGQEECDDANGNENDGCDSSCATVCGDGITAGIEDCDDGNVDDGDSCDSDCRACPKSLCKCLGAARGFTVVADAGVVMKTGKLSEFGGANVVESVVEGSMCAASGKFSAKELANQIDGDVVFRLGPGELAAKFDDFRIDGGMEPGTHVSGDVATGGGTLKKPEAVIVDGTVSLDGGHPLLPACAQASADVAVASAFLSALPPTQAIPDIIIDDGAIYELEVGPGLQVVNIGKIRVLSGKDDTGFAVPSRLVVKFTAATQTVIINVASELKMEEDGALTVSGPAGAVLLNLGPKAKLKLKPGSQVAPVLLVAGKTVKAPAFTSFGNVYAGSRVVMSGAFAEDILGCE